MLILQIYGLQVSCYTISGGGNILTGLQHADAQGLSRGRGGLPWMIFEEHTLEHGGLRWELAGHCCRHCDDFSTVRVQKILFKFMNAIYAMYMHMYRHVLTLLCHACSASVAVAASLYSRLMIGR